MPIQWKGTLSSPQQLAGVIQGEASSLSGQFAVASVMYNRLNAPADLGFVGAGTGDITKIVTPTQFNGYNPNPSANAQSLANDLYAGNPPSGGDTGNALFFKAPANENAATSSANPYFSTAPNIGGNYFSDNPDAPSSAFVAPAYGGATAAPDTALNNWQYPFGAGSYEPSFSEGSGAMFTAAGGQPTVYGGDTAAALMTIDPGQSGATINSLDNLTGFPGTQTTNLGTTLDTQSFSGAGATAGTAGETQSLPQAVLNAATQQSADTAGATKAETAAVGGLASTIKSAGDQSTQTELGLTDKILAWGSNLFVRAAIIIIGAILIWGAVKALSQSSAAVERIPA